MIKEKKCFVKFETLEVQKIGLRLKYTRILRADDTIGCNILCMWPVISYLNGPSYEEQAVVRLMFVV